MISAEPVDPPLLSEPRERFSAGAFGLEGSPISFEDFSRCFEVCPVASECGPRADSEPFPFDVPATVAESAVPPLAKGSGVDILEC
jgi:hypothetical protein